jgi:amino acid adenylation domain-containing protein
LALVVDEVEWTYAALAERAARIAGWVGAIEGRDGAPPRVGIFAYRSIEAYAALLGIAWAGATYVPINPRLPEDRIARLLDRAALDAAIVDDAGLAARSERIASAGPRRVLHPTAPSIASGDVDDATVLGRLTPEPPRTVAPDAIAYILFTSGTTGTPKGVMISVANVQHFLSAMGHWYARPPHDFSPADRFSQYSEMSFDVSVFDMFVPWSIGASVHVVPATQLLGPAAYIQKQRITVWFSVPSVIAFMRRSRQLQPGSFPNLRVSLFAGDALPIASVEAWRAAAPNGLIDNHYGPTETTVICTGERCDGTQRVTAERGIVAIGRPYPGMRAAVVDGEGRFLPPGEVGELAISGSQVMAGYFRDPELTARRCPRLRHPSFGEATWYLTGDLAREDADGVLHHLGRVDNQVKVQGNRVELEDLDAHLRAASGSDAAASVGWPIVDGAVQGLIAFVAGSPRSAEEIRAMLKQRVPSYMMPKRIVLLGEMPLSANGKIDRRALLGRLDSESA